MDSIDAVLGELFHPCRLHRWGLRVLDRRGLTGRQIADLVAERTAPER